MSTRIIQCIFASLTLTVAGAAWPARVSGQAPKEKAPAITMTGCLERSSDVSSSPYVLNNAARAATTTPRMGDPRVGAVGSATSSNVTPADDPQGKEAAKPARYALDGAEEKLAPHVNHRVEIVGELVPAPAGRSGSTAPLERVRVTGVKMVAADCAAR